MRDISPAQILRISVYEFNYFLSPPIFLFSFASKHTTYEPNVLQVCSTMVAEHLVSDLLEQSNLQELNGSEKQFEVETERLNSRLEHARANNAVLALTLHESKAQCDR